MSRNQGSRDVARREMIDTSIWDELADLKTPEAQHVYIWSFTNSRTNLCGIFKVRRETIELETKVCGAALDDALTELETTDRLYYDGTWMFIRTRTKRIATRTIQYAKSVVKGVREVPAGHPFRVRWVEIYGGESWLVPAEISTLTRPSPDPHQQHDSKRENADTRPRVTRPSVVDVVVDVSSTTSQAIKNNTAFEDIWDRHPVKRKLDAARASFFRIVDPEDAPAVDSQHRRHCERWRHDDPAFIPELHNWLDHWRDDPRPLPKSKVAEVAPTADDWEREAREVHGSAAA